MPAGAARWQKPETGPGGGGGVGGGGVCVRVCLCVGRGGVVGTLKNNTLIPPHLAKHEVQAEACLQNNQYHSHWTGLIGGG